MPQRLPSAGCIRVTIELPSLRKIYILEIYLNSLHLRLWASYFLGIFRCCPHTKDLFQVKHTCIWRKSGGKSENQQQQIIDINKNVFEIIKLQWAYVRNHLFPPVISHHILMSLALLWRSDAAPRRQHYPPYYIRSSTECLLCASNCVPFEFALILQRLLQEAKK